MQANGSINKAAAAKLPAASGTPTFLSASQFTDAANYLAANWAKAIGSRKNMAVAATTEIGARPSRAARRRPFPRPPRSWPSSSC